MYGYPAVFRRDEDGRLLVTFPDFPEVHTFGDDVDEAVVRARDALATIVDSYIDDRQPIPEPSMQSRGTYLIRLPALTQAKVDLYNAMREKGVTKTDLARRLGWHLPQVDRLLDVHHASRLDQLERAFDVLGKELFVASLASQSAANLRSAGTLRGRIGSKPRTRARQRTPQRRRSPAAKRK